MQLLLLLPYAWDTSPSQRFRIEQWTPWLRSHGVDVHPSTLLTASAQKLLYGDGGTAKKALMMAGCVLQRVAQLSGLRRFDAVWLHRAALPVGPALIERWIVSSKIPVIFEFDDAIYLTHTSEANRAFRSLKFSHKTAQICKLSSHIVVGNAYLAEYARRFNDNVSIIPTTIDTESYRARSTYRADCPVVIGWSGSGTTVAHLRTLDRVLQRVAQREDVRLHVIGTPEYHLEGVTTYARGWTVERELPELDRFDVGVMPLPDEEWARGKCALKALQYMALGIPTVTSPVGVNGVIIRDGENGFLASTEDEWVEKLLTLTRDVHAREKVGRAGRRTVETGYSALSQAPQVLEVLKRVVRQR
jgi:glycosyltransferase involved in cell wall biosynthesis